MISNIELTSDDESDENYSLMFVRKKKEHFLVPNARATQDMITVRPHLPRSATSWPTRPSISIST
jgi:hypothetical protein